MIERFRLWLCAWLRISDIIPILHREITAVRDIIGIQQKQIENLRAEVTRLSVAQYVPPQQEEPKPKVVQTRTMREFNAILDREFEQEEQNALR